MTTATHNRRTTELLPTRSTWKTSHPVALQWWSQVSARHAEANARVTDFGVAASALIGGCDHGNARHEIVTRRTAGSLEIVGVMAEVYELESPPKGTVVRNGVLVPDRTLTGRKLNALMAEHASDGLFLGAESVGVVSRLRVGSKVIQPGLGVDPIGGVLFQFWPAGQDIRDRISSAIARSSVDWSPTSEIDLERAKQRSQHVSQLLKAA